MINRTVKLMTFMIVLISVISAQTISVQGVLRDPLGKTVEDDTYPLTLKLYEQAVEGIPVWEEAISEVQILHGVFNLELGTVTPLDIPFNTTYYLGITVGTDPEIEPRMKLMKAPAAMSMSGSHNVIPSHGNMGVGTTNPQAGLHIVPNEAGGDLLKVDGSGGGVSVDVAGDFNVESGGAIKFADNSRLVSGNFNGIASHVRSDGDATITADSYGDVSVKFYVGDSLKMAINMEGVSIAGITDLGSSPGSMIMFTGSVAPEGWLLCDGSEYGLSEYIALYNVIGTSYGSGVGTFKVPDMRSRGAKGFNTTVAEFDTLGETGGSETVTLTENELPAHYHPYPGGISATTSTNGYHEHSLANTRRVFMDDWTDGYDLTDDNNLDGLLENGAWANYYDYVPIHIVETQLNHVHTYNIPEFTSGSKGNGDSHNILHPYMAVNYIIKY